MIRRDTILDRDQVASYLDRLGLDRVSGQEDCSARLLQQLQYAHVTRIPYENLDILLKIPLPTTCREQHRKIVGNRRGGYCFELNGLFAGLLSGLGYTVQTYMGRYLRGETEIPMRRHRVIRVDCAEGSFICDAGVGQPAPRFPLALVPGQVQEQFGEVYKIEQESFFGWVIYDRHHGEWRRFYSFTEEAQLEIDFVMPSFYCERSPDSIFNQSIMMAIKTEDGRKTLDGNQFRVFSAAGVSERTIHSLTELEQIIREHFLIRCPDLPESLLSGKGNPE